MHVHNARRRSIIIRAHVRLCVMYKRIIFYTHIYIGIYILFIDIYIVRTYLIGCMCVVQYVFMPRIRQWKRMRARSRANGRNAFVINVPAAAAAASPTPSPADRFARRRRHLNNIAAINTFHRILEHEHADTHTRAYIILYNIIMNVVGRNAHLRRYKRTRRMIIVMIIIRSGCTAPCTYIAGNHTHIFKVQSVCAFSAHINLNASCSGSRTIFDYPTVF